MTRPLDDKKPQSVTDPFLPHGYFGDNACVDNFMGFSQLSEYYTRSADDLVSCALEDYCLLDVHIYAICFLYRHGLELILKDIVWKTHYILTGEKRFAQSNWKELGCHGLSSLWVQGRVDSQSVLPDGLPFDACATDEVEQLLLQFERHDPNSYSFRYPIGKKIGRTHPDINNVNIRALRDRVRGVRGHLELLLSRINWCYEHHNE